MNDTSIEARPEWYEKGDLITLFVDEGGDNDAATRKAQLFVAKEETQSLLIMMSGEDETGHTFPIGPYQWTVQLLSKEAIRNMGSDGPDIVIAQCGGGDSTGFGYDWMFDRNENAVYMTEDPKGSRVKVEMETKADLA